MRNLFAIIFLSAVFAVPAFAQSVTLQTVQEGQGMQGYTINNNTAGTVCVVTVITTQQNATQVFFSPWTIVTAGNSANIGEFSQNNPQHPWNVQVRYRWFTLVPGQGQSCSYGS